MRRRPEDSHDTARQLLRPTTWVGSWWAPALTVAFTVFWVLLIILLIGDREARRDWQYGTVPFVPGQSVLTIEPVDPNVSPNQVELPVIEKGGPDASR